MDAAVCIRSEEPGDAPSIFNLHAACFPSREEAHLVDRLRAANRLTVSVVAEFSSNIVGHVAISPVMAAGVMGAGLGPVAVIESYRKQGIGGELVKAALAGCCRAGLGWVVVLGDPLYYSRFGFVHAADLGLHDAFGGGIAFQVLELKDSTLPRGAGLVCYAPEFSS